MPDTLRTLIALPNPAIAYRAAEISGAGAKELARRRAALPHAPEVQALLAGRGTDGRMPYNAYDKWYGPHWRLALLADLGYPPGDESLRPMVEQALGWMLSDERMAYIPKRTVNGRIRMHPSIEGNALWYLHQLGLPDGRMAELARLILSWEWPGGGWNCDMNPRTVVASFTETLLPLRGLAAHAHYTGDRQAVAAAGRAAEVFLSRRLFRRLSNGRVIHNKFVQLHYPLYWHYDILFALKVLSEAGFLNDPRCAEALDLLESKRLPDGGWPAEATYYQYTEKKVSGRSPVDWGGTSRKRMNPWVTLDALAVLKAAGREPRNATESNSTAPETMNTPI
ncbi:MAG: hypothetical protein HYZ26_09300 [Chloroflexi bacterium]|nr:hypothetical protein [Chloroflexota bacterium]